MRPRSPSSTALALAALGAAAGLSVAAPTASAVPTASAAQVTPAAPLAPVAPVTPAALACGAAADKEFPLSTRIHGGPEVYPAGGELRTWSLDLTNTTAEPCRDVHPILVLTDRDKVLLPGQIRAEFYDADARIWRPVAFESTDRAESVGVFEGPELQTGPERPVPAVPPFDGFAVPAGGTLTVPVRLAFGADAVPDEVTVSAAVVQKRGEDGDWVGASGAYRLTIGPAEPDGEDTEAADPATPTDPAPDPADPGAGTDLAAPGGPELARTGQQKSAANTARRTALRLAPVAAGLFAAGAALVLLARRSRRS
ncbi:hypothetical protein [Streptomyces sp. NPDC051909]|uniref:hypothetical protein n=1 Tax=Streptomyces sp. NPDC051909 TaxID=3154944 RepID=UPI00341BC755